MDASTGVCPDSSGPGILVGKRIAVLVDLVIGHVGRADVFAGDGVETETQLGSLGVDDDLLVLLIDLDDLADHLTDGDDLGAGLQVATEVLFLLLLLLGLLGLPPHHAAENDDDHDKHNGLFHGKLLQMNGIDEMSPSVQTGKV